MSARSSIFDANFFISIMFELGCTKFRIIQKAIVDPFEILLDASLFQIMEKMIFFLFWSFPISVAMRLSNLELRECPMKTWMTPRLASLSFKKRGHVQ